MRASLLQNAYSGQFAQPRRKNVLGNSEAPLKIGKPAISSEEITYDQERPSLSDQFQAAGDRAVLEIIFAP